MMIFIWANRRPVARSSSEIVRCSGARKPNPRIMLFIDEIVLPVSGQSPPDCYGRYVDGFKMVVVECHGLYSAAFVDGERRIPGADCLMLGSQEFGWQTRTASLLYEVQVSTTMSPVPPQTSPLDQGWHQDLSRFHRTV